jgi:hypothetical protein
MEEVFARDGVLASVSHLIISSFFLAAKIIDSFYTVLTSTCRIAYSSVVIIHTTTCLC